MRPCFHRFCGDKTNQQFPIIVKGVQQRHIILIRKALRTKQLHNNRHKQYCCHRNSHKIIANTFYNPSANPEKFKSILFKQHKVTINTINKYPYAQHKEIVKISYPGKSCHQNKKMWLFPFKYFIHTNKKQRQIDHRAHKINIPHTCKQCKSTKSINKTSS